MSFDNDNMIGTIPPGFLAAADGNYAPNVAQGASPAAVSYARAANDETEADASAVGAQHAAPLLGTVVDLGPNNERLEDVKPELVNALRELVRQYRQEGIVARRHEIRRIRQARLFWQGLQYAWWNPNDMNWHLPYENRSSDDRQLEEMPRYQFVTNFYQGFGLSFIAVLSQDVPSDLTDQQLANINVQNQQFLNQQQQTGNLLNSQFQSILNNPGLSSADKAAVTGQSQGAIASAFDSLQQSAANRVARTGNSAGFSELTDDLARQKAVAEGNQAQQNQLAFTNTAFQRQMSALQGLSGLFGVDSNLLGRTLGIPSRQRGKCPAPNRPRRQVVRPRRRGRCHRCRIHPLASSGLFWPASSWFVGARFIVPDLSAPHNQPNNPLTPTLSICYTTRNTAEPRSGWRTPRASRTSSMKRGSPT